LITHVPDALAHGAEIYMEHDAASFGNKMMWWPVVVMPTAVPAGISSVCFAPRGEDRAAVGVGGHRRQRPTGHVPAPARLPILEALRAGRQQPCQPCFSRPKMRTGKT
jgi:hypothetical protein